MRHCRSSAGLKAASSSTPPALLAGTRRRKVPWKWPVGPCRPPPSPLLTEAAEETDGKSGQHVLFLGLVFGEESEGYSVRFLACSLLISARAGAVLFCCARSGC